MTHPALIYNHFISEVNLDPVKCDHNNAYPESELLYNGAAIPNRKCPDCGTSMMGRAISVERRHGRLFTRPVLI